MSGQLRHRRLGSLAKTTDGIHPVVTVEKISALRRGWGQSKPRVLRTRGRYGDLVSWEEYGRERGAEELKHRSAGMRYRDVTVLQSFRSFGCTHTMGERIGLRQEYKPE